MSTSSTVLDNFYNGEKMEDSIFESSETPVQEEVDTNTISNETIVEKVETNVESKREEQVEDEESVEDEEENSDEEDDDEEEEEEGNYVYLVVENSELVNVYKEKRDALECVMKKKEMFIVQNISSKTFEEEQTVKNNVMYYRVYSYQKYYIFLYMRNLEKEYRIIKVEVN